MTFTFVPFNAYGKKGKTLYHRTRVGEDNILRFEISEDGKDWEQMISIEPDGNIGGYEHASRIQDVSFQDYTDDTWSDE